MNITRQAPSPRTTSRSTSDPAVTTRRGPTTLRARAAAAFLALVVLTGCGIRLESPTPAALPPDADEISRQAMVADALSIRDEAAKALTLVAPETPEAASLAQVVAFAELHVDALGGEYSSGLAEQPGGDGEASDNQTPVDPDSLSSSSQDKAVPGSPPSDPVVTPDADPETPATSTSVVEHLTQSAARARGSLATPTNGSLARLYTSIAASHLASARALAATIGTPFIVPAVFTSDAPESLPAHISAAELTTLVRNEDAAGYAYEVIAARAAPEQRAFPLGRSTAHRDRAQDWARLASIDRTSSDPRALAYDLSAGADSTLAVAVESALADGYTTLAGRVDPDVRAVMLDLAVDASAAAGAWGAPLVPFPGMPEQL